MSGQHKQATWEFFSPIGDPTQPSTATCAAAFDEMDVALKLLNSSRADFNPLQRQLIGRFIATCKVFGRNMLAAGGNPDALRAVFGLPVSDEPGNQVGTQATGHAVIDQICTEVCQELELINSVVQIDLLEGHADTIADIQATQNLTTLECETLDAMALSLRGLAHNIAALFQAQPYALRRFQLAYHAEIEAVDRDAAATPLLTIEEFMQAVKPPVRPPSLHERLEPFLPQLERLREQGYSYAQCAHFLRENGVSTSPAALSNVLRVAIGDCYGTRE